MNFSVRSCLNQQLVVTSTGSVFRRGQGVPGVGRCSRFPGHWWKGGGWLVGISDHFWRAGWSQLVCEQGGGLRRSQQVTGACGDLGAALERLGSFWRSRGVALIPRFSPCARLLLVWDSKREISSVWQTQLALPHQSARKKGRFHQRL